MGFPFFLPLFLEILQTIHTLLDGLKIDFMECGCHCIKCKSTELESIQVGKVGNDGYFDMHHTCKKCNTHFDHLEGDVFDDCKICNYKPN